jgi:type I restriction enzyme S subunit
MAEWIITNLEKCTDVLGDGLHGTPKYTENGEYAFVNGNNLVDGEILIKKETKRVDYSQYEKYKKTLTNRTILVSINGTLGNVGVYDSEKIILGKSACYFNVKESVDKDFIYYIVSSPAFKQYLESNATGTTIKNISLKQMKKYTFSLPKISEQKRISSVLRKIDEKIKNNRAINNNLEQQAKALYKDWFFTFSPFSADGTLPDGWRVGTVNDIIQLHDSKRVPLSGAERDKMAKIYPYYGATSLMDYVGNYLFNGIYLLLGEDGTVVDSLGFPILQYVYGKFWVNNHAHIITGKEGFSVEELYLFFSLTNIKSIVTGAVQQKVSQQNLKKVPAIIPRKEALNAFDELIQPIFAQIRNLRDENARLAELRDTLLPKLMSGELDVSNIEL